MALIPSVRNNIQQEEVDFRSPVSEATWTKIGGAINLINLAQYDTHTFNLNGPINLFDETVGVDGFFVFQFDAEIVGYSQSIGQAVSGGTSLILDVHRLENGDTDLGSIWTTRPQIANTAANGTYSAFRVTDSTILAQPTGHSVGSLNVTEVNAGDALRLDIDQKSGMRNYSLNIHYRPR